MYHSSLGQHAMLFISHAKEDTQIAESLADRLESEGAQCWLARREVPGGGDYAESITRAIDQCHTMLVVVSGQSVDSAHVKREIDLAISKGRLIIPVLLGDVLLPDHMQYRLSTAQWVKLSSSDAGESLEDCVTQILRSVGPKSGDASAGIRKAKTRSSANRGDNAEHRGRRFSSRIVLVAIGTVIVGAALAGIWKQGVLPPGIVGQNPNPIPGLNPGSGADTTADRTSSATEAEAGTIPSYPISSLRDVLALPAQLNSEAFHSASGAKTVRVSGPVLTGREIESITRRVRAVHPDAIVELFIEPIVVAASIRKAISGEGQRSIEVTLRRRPNGGDAYVYILLPRSGPLSQEVAKKLAATFVVEPSSIEIRAVP